MSDAPARARQQAIRAAARSASPMARRTYLLPADLVARIVEYQAARLIPHEVVAVRELLDFGLGVKGF